MKEKELEIQFTFRRYHRIHKFMDYILLLAFIIFASTSLLFLPYTNMYKDIESAKAFNENLRNQLTILEQELPPVEKPSSIEQNYSQAYEFLSSQETDAYKYIVNILDSQIEGISITSIQLDDSQKSIRVLLTSVSEVAINEFMIKTYENYGVLQDLVDESRWIIQTPARISTTTNLIEVVFYYA
ncbi:MAG: hypothetical protein WCY62_01930 [Clostridia bacterium]|jgi:hypothetical protein